MKAQDTRRLEDRKTRLEERLDPSWQEERRTPMLAGAIVRERGFTNLVLEKEGVAELPYTPSKAKGSYRMIVLRKTIRVEKGQLRLEDEKRYFFYVTNVPCSRLSADEVVAEANARCDQENVIEQLKNGVHAMRMPPDGLHSNWAYLVIAALAWNLKAWTALSLPDKKAGRELLRMHFRRRLHALMLVRCQVVRSGRRLVLRILAWSPWARVLIDGMEHVRRCRFT